jgi:hypothetical protein
MLIVDTFVHIYLYVSMYWTHLPRQNRLCCAEIPYHMHIKYQIMHLQKCSCSNNVVYEIQLRLWFWSHDLTTPYIFKQILELSNRSDEISAGHNQSFSTIGKIHFLFQISYKSTM